MNDDHAMTRGELAARIGVSPNWVSRNVPARLFVGGRIHWHEYCAWREGQQQLPVLKAEISELATAADPQWLEALRKSDALSSSNGHTTASHAPAVSQPHDSE
jgi:hypothetical protein